MLFTCVLMHLGAQLPENMPSHAIHVHTLSVDVNVCRCEGVMPSIYTPSHLHTFTSTHIHIDIPLPSHVHTITSTHIHIDIPLPSHLHTLTSMHYIYTPSHLHILTSTHPHIYTLTSAHPQPPHTAAEFISKLAAVEEQHAQQLNNVVKNFRRRTSETLRKES